MIQYISFIERQKIRSKSLVLGLGARKNLSVIKSYTRTVNKLSLNFNDNFCNRSSVKTTITLCDF